MLAVILAAGRGSRMGSLTATTPKPLLPLQGRPILEHILAGIRAAGIDRVVIVTGYLATAIEDHFGAGEHYGLQIEYRRQTTPTGTAKAVLLAADAIGDEPFLLSWGDILIEPHEYAALRAAFEKRRCEALLAVNRVDDPWRGAAVYIDAHDNVTRIVEKPPRGTSTTPWNNAGVFVLAASVLGYARDLAPSERDEYELPQALAAMVVDGRKVCAAPLHGYWSDLGTPEDLHEAQSAFPGAARQQP